MTSIVDLDKHIREQFEAYCLETFRDSDKAVTTKVSYNDVRFDSQINYFLDQLSPNTNMDTIDEMEQRNSTSQSQPMTISRTEEVTNSYSWSAEHGFSVGVEVSASFKVPFIGGMDTKISTEYSFKSTKTQTEERKRSWNFSQTVNVSPQTNVKALLMLQKTQPRIPFEMTCVINGNLLLEADLYKNGKKISATSWPVQLAWAIARKPLTGFSWSGYTAYFKSSGVFTASEGIKAIIDLKETSLTQRSLALKHQLIDVTPSAEPELVEKDASELVRS